MSTDQPDPVCPSAKAARLPDERAKIQRVIRERGLCGLANDTKWDELIAALRGRKDWRPSYRYKCVDRPPSDCDVEWFYHLPFPLISVEWLDVFYLQEVKQGRLLAPCVTDHSTWLEPLIREIGFNYLKGSDMIRIFGYSPRNYELFVPLPTEKMEP